MRDGRHCRCRMRSVSLRATCPATRARRAFQSPWERCTQVHWDCLALCLRRSIRTNGISFFSCWFSREAFALVYGVQPLAGLSEKMPVFQGLKKDEAIVLVDFSLATLAGLGVSRLEVFQWSQSTTRTRILLFVTLLVTTVALHWSTALLSAVSKPGVDWW